MNQPDGLGTATTRGPATPAPGAPCEGPRPTSVAMWEVRARPGHADELVCWVQEFAQPAIAGRSGLHRTELFRSDDRVVVITHWTGDPHPLPEPPARLLARPPHCWRFAPIATWPGPADQT